MSFVEGRRLLRRLADSEIGEVDVWRADDASARQQFQSTDSPETGAQST